MLGMGTPGGKCVTDFPPASEVVSVPSKITVVGNCVSAVVGVVGFVVGGAVTFLVTVVAGVLVGVDRTVVVVVVEGSSTANTLKHTKLH